MYITQLVFLTGSVTAITISKDKLIETRQVGANFPSGSIPCSTFPSQLGAVNTDWLNNGGWTGIQSVPGYKLGDPTIGTVINNPAGPCIPNAFCSYACPVGLEKTQFPAAQPTTGQTVGGLFCNSNGFLELSNPSVTTLCAAGVGGVLLKNSLINKVSVCRTDFPGNEVADVPLDAEEGSTSTLTVPPFNYFVDLGKQTSAQYFVNPAAVTVEDACQFGTPGSNVGNFAPVTIGVGHGNSANELFVALAPNTPASTGTLDFNIRITGGVSSDCEYQNGQFLNNGVVSSSGCTVSVSGGATVEFF